MKTTKKPARGPAPPMSNKKRRPAVRPSAASKASQRKKQRRASAAKTSTSIFAAQPQVNRQPQRGRVAVNPARDREAALREHARRRKQRIRRRKIFIYSIILLFVTGISIILSLTVFFHIETIAVQGNSRYAAQNIINETGIKIQDNLFMANTQKAEEAILSAFPYVKAAEIKRAFPSGLVIEVTETQAAFVIKQNEKLILLDEDGRVLETGLSSSPEGLPVITGVEFTDITPGQAVRFKDEETAAVMRKIMAAVSACGIKSADYISETTPQSERGNISLIDLSDPLNLRLLFDERLTLELGMPADLEYKLEFAKSAIDKLADDARGTLDLSVLKKATFSPEKTEPELTTEPEPEEETQESADDE